MPPLTSPSGCNRCLQLDQAVLDHRRTIAELEGRISILHYIREEEEITDSLVTVVLILSGFASVLVSV